MEIRNFKALKGESIEKDNTPKKSYTKKLFNKYVIVNDDGKVVCNGVSYKVRFRDIVLVEFNLNLIYDPHGNSVKLTIPEKELHKINDKMHDVLFRHLLEYDYIGLAIKGNYSNNKHKNATVMKHSNLFYGNSDRLYGVFSLFLNISEEEKDERNAIIDEQCNTIPYYLRISGKKFVSLRKYYKFLSEYNQTAGEVKIKDYFFTNYTSVFDEFVHGQELRDKIESRNGIKYIIHCGMICCVFEYKGSTFISSAFGYSSVVNRNRPYIVFEKRDISHYYKLLEPNDELNSIYSLFCSPDECNHELAKSLIIAYKTLQQHE